MRPLPDLYRDGGRAEAWARLADRCRSDPGFADGEEAATLARLTFERVARNVDRLIERLRALGYAFECEDPEVGEPQPPRRPVAVADLAILADPAWPGPFPLALRSCAEIVGTVDLRQSMERPSRPGDDPVLASLGDWDPLCFEPEALIWMLEEAVEAGADEDDPRVHVSFAPDIYHKAGVSGADGYIISLPDRSPDPLVTIGFAACRTIGPVSFTTYLRQVVARGGFYGSPHLVYDRRHGWLGDRDVAPGLYLPRHPVFAHLSDGLEPI